jgi:TonB-linked SusC/RagA family outer membrane protein
MRVDGSSRFGKDNKYGFFPSGAFAWRLSEEEFIQDLNLFSDLKFRISHGLTGNADAISPYQTLPRLGYAPYNFNSNEVAGYYESNMPSPNLKWESTQQTNVGLDVSFFNSRLNFVMDYYYKNTKDLIRAINIPAVAGFPNTYVNMGNLQNKGFEFEVRSVNLNGLLTWRTSLLFALNRNKLTSLGDGSDRIGTTHWLGKPLGIGNRYLIEAIGIWQTNEKDEAAKYGSVPGDVKYRDLNDDGVINNEDRDFVGSYYPNFYGSLNNEFVYKSFDLNIFATFQQGRDVYNGNNYILLLGAAVDNNRIEMLDRWTPTNPSNKYPRASASGKNRLSTETSEFLEDASFLKIKNITLGYNLSNTISQRYDLSSARIYMGITNPFTFTRYTGMDPEDGDIWNNSRQSSYPITTTYTIGLQLQF